MPSTNVLVTSGGIVVPAPANGRIRLLGYQVSSAGNPGVVTLQSGSNILAGVNSFSNNGGGLCARPSGVKEEFYGECNLGDDLFVAQTTAGVAVDVNVQYTIIPGATNPGTQPNFVSASVDTTGSILTVNLSRVVTGYGTPTVTADGVGVTLTYRDGNGTSSIRYDITNGNPGTNPILSGATILITATANTWTAGGAGNTAISGQSVTNGSRMVNAGVFASASSQSLSVASNASLQPTDNFWFSGWVKPSTVGTNQVIFGKFNASGNQKQFYAKQDNTNTVNFYVSSNGSSDSVQVNSSNTVSLNTWYHVFAWIDTVSSVIGIILNGTQTTAAYSSGIFKTGTASLYIGTRASLNLYQNGTSLGWVYGKDPVGGFATIPAATIATALYNGGLPLRPSQLSSAQKTAWGVVSGWLDTTLTADVIGTNTLTNNNAVTETTVTF